MIKWEVKIMDDIGVKLALGCMVIICGALSGRALARANIRRCALLAETMDAVQLLRIHMLDSLMPLGAALEKSAGYIFQETGRLLADKSAAEAWRELKAAQHIRGGRLDCLAESDISTLDSFFEILGSSSREEQRHVFETVIKELGALESAARGEGEKKNRLYTALGALAGAAAVVGMI